MDRPTRGFTLIELLVVISIIALLSSVVLASVNAAREKARIAAGRQFSAQSYRVAAEQAVGIWDFDECSGTVAGDRSGNGSAGSLTNGASFSSDTPTGTGCSVFFDGSNDYVRVPDSDLFTFPTATFSISLWVKLASFAAAQDALVAKASYTDGQREWAFLKCDTGSSACPVQDRYALLNNHTPADGGAWLSVITSQTAQAGSWHHLAVSVEGGQAKIYVNGALSGSAAIRATMQNMGADLTMGATDNAGVLNQQLHGYLDEVRIYAKSLSAGEVGKIYAEGLKGVRVADGI